MGKEYQEKMDIQGYEITVISKGDNEDYISLTDIAKRKNAEDPRIVISNWLSSYATIDYLATWENLYNPDFNRMEFHTVRSEPGRLVMTPSQWIKRTNAIGIKSKAGRYGGTFAHKDIAFEFASWISPEFKLYIIKDYQRLKEDENNRLSLNWNLRRVLSKTNYKIHTDAIQENLISNELPKSQQGIVYANEADVLNMALFGMTAKEWRVANPDKAKSENIRDSATIEQLIVLTNLESYNAQLIKEGLSQYERLLKLREFARSQMKSLIYNPSLKTLT